MLATADDDRSSPSAGVMQDAAPVQALLAQAAHGRAAHFGLAPPLAVGQAHSLSLTAHPILHEQGDPTSRFIAFARHDAQPGVGDTAAASDEPFRGLFESIDEGVATLEILFEENGKAIDYRFLAVNRAHQAMSGLGSEVVGKRISEVMPDIAPSVIQRLGKVALTGEPARFEDFIRPLNRWYEVYLSRFGNPGSRTVVSVFRDVTERKHRERLQVFLLTLSDALRPLVDPQEIQVLAADLLGEHLQVNQANYGEVRGERVHISHSYADGLSPMVGSFHAEDFGKRLMDGHRAGRLQVCANTTSDPLFDEQERKALAAAHVGAYIAVPLVKEGVWVGVLSVLNIQPRVWSPTEVEAVQEVAERTWAAVERTRAERALRRSEEKYRSLFELIDEGVSTIEVLFDAQDKAIDFKVLEVNAAHEAMTGQGRDVVGKRGREFIGDLEQSMMERLGQVALTGQPIRFEEFVSGLGRWFDIYVARDGGSDSRRVISVFNNITERKRREANLRFLAETSMDFAPLMGAADIMQSIGVRLAQYLGLARCSFSVVDMDSDQIDCIYSWRRDDAMQDFFGKHRISTFLNESGRQHYAAGQLSVIDDAQNNPLLSPSAHALLDQLSLRSIVDVPYIKDGRWRFLLTAGRSTAGKWDQGEIELVRTLAERIFLRVERALVEEALRESEVRLRESDARLRLAVKSSNVGLWDWNVTDHRVYFSPEWKDQLGYGEDELSDRFEEWESRVHPDDKTRMRSHIEEYFRESASAYEDEFRLRHKDGSYRWIYTRAELLRDAAGTPERMAGCHVDITERKRAEEALRRTAARTRELQRRLTETGEHERRALHRELHDRIGQDLATAKLNIELASALPSAEIGNRLGVALELVQSAIATSRNIMAELRPPGLDDHGLGVALRILAGSLEDRLPIAVSVRDVDFELRLPQLIETALFRIAQEAINNLIKYANARAVEISFVQEAQEVRLMIADDGCGFDATRLPESGSYGLQIMRERAEAVDAKLKVDSVPGRGTRIIAVLERTA